MLHQMSIQESGELHNARPTLWHAHWRLAGNGPVLLLDRNFIGLSSSLDEKECTMSAMSNYYLDKQTDAIKYLAAQGIDEESLWDAAEDSYNLVIGLAEMHRNDISVETIKRIISEVNL